MCIADYLAYPTIYSPPKYGGELEARMKEMLEKFGIDKIFEKSGMQEIFEERLEIKENEIDEMKFDEEDFYKEKLKTSPEEAKLLTMGLEVFKIGEAKILELPDVLYTIINSYIDLANVYVKTGDGVIREIKHRNARLSRVLRKVCFYDFNEVDVKSSTIEDLITYFDHHCGFRPPIVEKPLRSKLMRDVVKDIWDANFIDAIAARRDGSLFKLRLAAKCLDIYCLFNLCCARIAAAIKGQPIERCREILADLLLV